MQYKKNLRREPAIVNQRVVYSIIFILIVWVNLFPGCSQAREWILNVRFELTEREGYPRSDQMVIWLEKSDGTFVTTLFVSEYLSYGGYNHPGICPEWVTKANWEEASQEEFDAATGATPPVGPVNLTLACSSEQVPKGKYRILLEVHLTEDYNELYSGEVLVSGRKFSNPLDVSFEPEKYIKATHDVLSGVQVSINQ